MPSESYNVIRTLGSGTVGYVVLVQRVSDGKLIARKSINVTQEYYLALANNERRVLRALRHPNIVKYIGHERFPPGDVMQLMFEYCSFGTLSTTIQTYREQRILIPFIMSWSYFGQLVSALKHCHHSLGSNIVLHRDIKPENILIGDGGVLKLSDFGSSLLTHVSHLPVAERCLTTLPYSAPEIVAYKAWSAAADIWALGCVTHEICTLTPAFIHPDRDTTENMILQGTKTGTISSNYGELGAFVDMMLAPDPNQRPTAATLRSLLASSRTAQPAPSLYLSPH